LEISSNPKTFKNVPFYINPKLRDFRNEITYVFNYLGEHLGLAFLESLDKPKTFYVGYGDDSAPFNISTKFFDDLVLNTEEGIILDTSALAKELNQHSFVYKGESYIALFIDKEADIFIFESTEKVELRFDLIGAIFFFLSRIEERSNIDLDRHQRFKLQNTLAYKLKIHDVPVVNYWVDLVSKILDLLLVNMNHKRYIKVHPTHDVDRLRSYHSLFSELRLAAADVIKGRKSLRKGSRNFLGHLLSKEPESSFHYLLDISEKFLWKSHFFFMASSNYQQDANYLSTFPDDARKMVKLIKSRGHKIGIHPGYYTFNQKELWLKQRNELESFIDQKVISSRQHVLRWSFPETLTILEDLGIAEDYSMAFPEGISFRSGTTYSHYGYHLKNRKSSSVRLYPTPIMEFALFMDKYINISNEEAFKKVNHCLDQFKKWGGDLTILFHTVTVMQLRPQYERLLQLVHDKLVQK